ncbi:MAG: ubiquinone biosynthesis protein UbiA, partial [Spirochaetota bacterium]
GLTFILVLISVDPRGLASLDARAIANALAVALLLLGIFPLTQVYQHEADASRGDLTISLLVGIRGTFVLSGICLALGIGTLGYFVFLRSGWPWTLVYALAQAPAAGFFLLWFLSVLRDPRAADFRSTMRMNLFASGLLNTFYIAYLAIDRIGRFY